MAQVAGPDSVLGGAATQDCVERSPLGPEAVSTAAGFVNGAYFFFPFPCSPCFAYALISLGVLTSQEWVRRAPCSRACLRPQWSLSTAGTRCSARCLLCATF